MAKKSYMRLKGSQNFRLRLLLATLSSTPIVIADIRSDETAPGLRNHEVNLLWLFDKLCDDSLVEINETGTALKYKPGIIMGGKFLEHDCGLSRSIGYFLEPLIVLCLFAKRHTQIKLQGITNDEKDPSVDTFRLTTLNILKRFGVPSEWLDLKIVNRGVAPMGGGEIMLSVPIVHNHLTAVNWIDDGMAKRIRGVSFSARVSSQFENNLRHSARGIFNHLLPDVHIFTDHKAGAEAGKSPGYGVSLVAETTSGCFLSVDITVSYGRKDEIAEMHTDEKVELKSAEDVGVEIASALLDEVELGGVVDSTHQGLLFLLCALCPPDVSKVRVGKLSQHGMETLRLIRDFLDVKFVIKPDPSTGTVILKFVGCGMNNLSKKLS